LLACPPTMTLQRLSLSNSSHRRYPRTMTMTTTARNFQWSIGGSIRNVFQAPALLDTAKGQLSCFC
jgi:hypothetical protein